MRIAVAGGTGTVGRYVVETARARGHEPLVLSRRAGVDVATGERLEGAMEGVDLVIDTANAPSSGRTKATAFFRAVAANLQRAGAAAGASRLVTLSIVNIDTVPYGYYRAKQAHEEAALAGPLPATIVRATQFHEFAGQVLTRTRLGPVAVMPVTRVQPVAARAVAEVLVETALDPPGEVRFDIAGPRPEELVAMARALARRKGHRLAVLPLPVPGAAGRAMRAGGLVPGSGARLVGPAFEEWLGGEDAAAAPF